MDYDYKHLSNDERCYHHRLVLAMIYHGIRQRRTSDIGNSTALAQVTPESTVARPNEGGMEAYGIAVLIVFSSGISVILIFKCGIAGFQCYAIQNRSKSKSKSSNR